MKNIFASAGKKIVKTDNFVSFGYQSFAKMRADKAHAARYKYSHNLNSRE